MPVESVHCPNCGAVLHVRNYTSMTTCDYCHSTIRLFADVPGVKDLIADGEQLPEIENALIRLLQRSNLLLSSIDYVFVILEENQSQKFVQFSCRSGDPINLDLPEQTLSSMEMERATKFFLDHGLGGAKDMGGYMSFNFDIGYDVGSAARITLAIFRQVYQFPDDFQLIIKDEHS